MNQELRAILRSKYTVATPTLISLKHAYLVQYLHYAPNITEENPEIDKKEGKQYISIYWLTFTGFLYVIIHCSFIFVSVGW